MRSVKVAVDVIGILVSLWFISPANSEEVKLNLTGLPVNQSSVYYFANRLYCVPDLAIDGDYNTNFYDDTCSHTDDSYGVSSWWRIDLGQSPRAAVKVQRIVIFNRSDCCGERLDNFVAGLTNDSSNPVRGYYALCGQYPGAAADRVNLSLQCYPGTPSGRYVIVQQGINVYSGLAICEIEIYAGQVRKYGCVAILCLTVNRWKRLSNQRFVSVGAIILSKRSALMCVGKCQETVDCESVNYRQMDKTCEMNFLPPGADGTYVAVENGTDNWVQTYEFI